MAILNQAICSFVICYVCACCGLIFTWPSCTYNNFASVNSTLHRQMTSTELSLLGSLPSIGALISTPCAGLLLDRFGRKYSVVAAATTQVLVWSLIATFNQVEVILLAVFISGIGGSVFLVVPVYVSEICQESIRGAMCCFTMIFYSLGMLLSYLMGGYLPYQTMVYICLTMAVVGVCLLMGLRESPTALMNKGLEREAAQAMAFYRGAKVDSKLVKQEMDTLRRAFNPDFDTELKTPEEQKLKEGNNAPAAKLSVWQFFKKSRSTRQAALVTLVISTTSIFQGLIVLQVYAQPLFEKAVPNMSSTICSVVLALITIAMGIVTAYLTEAAGRKPLLIYGSLATCLCCVVLGTQLQLQWAPHWVTAVCMYLYCSSYTLGPGTVPYVLFAEVFLPEVKSVMSMVVMEWAWFCQFIILFIFGPIVEAIGLGPVFYFFAGMCVCTAVYAYYCLPETKGLPTDAVQMLFAKRSRRAYSVA